MSKKIYITESQFKAIVKEMAYPTSFNFDEFRELKSFAARARYCDARLRKIGAGSSRITYAVDDEKVLKLAKNPKGVAQNNVENQGWLSSYDMFAKVYEYDENGLWLEMQLARKAKPNDFKRLTGYGFDVFCAYVDYVHEWYARPSRYYGPWRNHTFDEIFDSEQFRDGLDNYNLFSQVQAYMCDTQLESVGDMKRLSSWGVVSENGEENLVMIDFGLDDEVFNTYYSRKVVEEE